MSVRVYLPTTWRGLTSLVSDQEWPDVRAAEGAEPVVAEGESEDEEYAALMTAADASTVLVAGAGESGRRRVVLVAEVATPDEQFTAAEVVAVHLDPDDRGDDADPDDDLAWFAPDELSQLL